MATVAQRWSVNALSVEFALNHRTTARRLARVEPAGENGHGVPVYMMVDAAPALLKVEDGRATAADLNLEKTRLTRAQADKAEHDLAIRRGEYLPADDAVAGWENAIIRCRELLLAIPSAHGDELAALAQSGDRRGFHDLLDDRIRGALAELANTQVEADDDPVEEVE